MEYIAQEYMRACELAESELWLYKNNFAGRGFGERLEFNGSYSPDIRYWKKLEGFRALSDLERTKGEAESAALKWVKGNTSGNGEAVMLLQRSGGTAGVYYGTSYPGTEPFTGSLPEAIFNEEAPNPIKTSYNGFIIGSFSMMDLSDAVLDLECDNLFAAACFLPLDPNSIRAKLEEISSKIMFLTRFRSFTKVYGTATRRNEEVVNPMISEAIDALKDTADYLKTNLSSGIVGTIIKVGAERKEDFEKLVAIIKGCSGGNDKTYSEPVRTYAFEDEEMFLEEHLSIPRVRIPRDRGSLLLCSMQTLSCAGKICIPPIRTHEGYFIKDYKVNEDTGNVFKAQRTHDTGISLGKTKEGGRQVYLPESIMCCHTAVLGSAGGGKTTTVKNLLMNLNDKGLPFLVIEAAKKEYFEMAADIPGLQVLTPGTNGARLMINPLEPEDGTLIENQVDMLVRSIVAAHGGEHPIPEGLEGLLKHTYEKKGWRYGMMAYSDPLRPFPTCKDVYDNVDDYVNEHARYGSENRQNLIAALTIRSETLHTGALGAMFSEPHGIMAEELLKSPTVIELDDLSESAVILLMNVLLYRIQSYLAKQGRSDTLKRVIVVEEAHNVFRKTVGHEEGRDINNRYFEKMLSEIRASGTGLIISDQRPSILTEALMENTAIKVIHAMEEREDRDAVASAIDLTDIQKKKLREFIPGECIVSMRGTFGISDIYVDMPQTSSVMNVFCPMCPKRYECIERGDALRGINIDVKIIRDILGNLSKNAYNQAYVKRAVSDLMEMLDVTGGVRTKCCTFGKLLAKYSDAPLEVKRILVTMFFNSLNEGVA